MVRLPHRYLHGCGAVVGRIGLSRHCVHARAVVVWPGRRGRGHVHRLPVAPGRRKPCHRVRPHFRVRCRDGRVRRPEVAQRRRRRFAVAVVLHRRRQGETHPCGRAVVAHRRRHHRQIRMVRLPHRYLHGWGAVVGRIGLSGHRVHARAVVVRPGRRGRGQLHRLAVASGRRKPCHRVRPHFRVRCRDGRVRGQEVAQRRRRRFAVAVVLHRRRQGELRSNSRAVVAHRRRHHRQIRMFRLPHRYLHGCRAVVGRIGLSRHRVHARPVVVRPGRRGRDQLHRLAVAPGRRKALPPRPSPLPCPMS